MQFTRHVWCSVALVVVAVAIVGMYATVDAQQVGTPAQTPTATSPVADGRFQFEVIESFDAKYQGDSPGHIGKHGELGDFRPQAALGDPVFRGEEKIGTVTNLVWSRGHGSLEVEFDPEPKARIAVGDVVWLKMGDGN